MKATIEKYNDCTIAILDDGQLCIDDKLINYECDLNERQWHSEYLPYSQYNSLLDLAKAIVDNTEEFGFRPL